MRYGGFYSKLFIFFFWSRGRCGNCLMALLPFFTVTHVQGSSGMYAQAANALQRNVPHLSKTWLFFITSTRTEISWGTRLMFAVWSIVQSQWLTQTVRQFQSKHFNFNFAPFYFWGIGINFATLLGFQLSQGLNLVRILFSWRLQR